MKTGLEMMGYSRGGDVINFNFPEDGILFPKGIFASTVTNVAAVTLLTDKYSGPNMTTSNPG